MSLISLIHTSFSARTTLQFFESIGHNNKKSQKNFFSRLVFVGGRKMCFFIYNEAKVGKETTVGLKLSWLKSGMPQDYYSQISLKLDK